MSTKSFSSAVDEYISGFPVDTQRLLEQLRLEIHASAPGATEIMSYGIPTLDLNSKHLVHFGGFSKHVGFYPTPTGMEEFSEQITHYKSGKGSLKFELGEPLPSDLVRQIIAFRVSEVMNE